MARLSSTTAIKQPYQEQDPHEISAIVEVFKKSKHGGAKSGWRAKSTSFDTAGSPSGIVVDSWKLQDHDYKRAQLPTYARGLFTTKNSRGQDEIATRGYDKFFNVGEVPDTKWDNIKKNTKGPYELTLKENGCIIFVSGLEDETLLVCSKHSTRARGRENEVSHSKTGEEWVDRQLAAIGKTRRDLARELRARNATAVAELCDDAFEEHILAYPPERAGLYLHGININIPQFMTYPMDQVAHFADEWGFKTIKVNVLEDVDKVKKFLDDCAESGAWEGIDVEGFVIRCKMSQSPTALPYHDWFFKYKFEEPYLMYRQWRECTKSLVSGKPPRFKKHISITEEYLAYARKRLQGDPALAKAYMANHGIIAMRDGFLASKNIKGADAAGLEEGEAVESTQNNDGSDLVTGDVILVPISTLGCGKTTVAAALTHLFGWGHVQNDDISGKGRPARMVKQVGELLQKHAAVVSDRNNAERRERGQIINDMKHQSLNARLVALNFVTSDMREIRRVTQERVLARGDNHQTIQAKTDEKKVLGIMRDFIDRFQPCDPLKSPDSGFDLVIDLDGTKDSRLNLETAVRALHEKYHRLVPEVPSKEALDEAIRFALEEYTPQSNSSPHGRNNNHNHNSNKKGKNQLQQNQGAKKLKPLEYMSVSVPSSIVVSALDKAFQGTDPQVSMFYKQLQQSGRVQSAFHVTLMHRAASNQHPELWDSYVKLAGDQDLVKGLGECEVELERVVFDDRIMAVVVRLVDEEERWKCGNRVAHVTIGTRDGQVKPKESNDLLAKWLEEGCGDKNGIAERVLEDRPVVKGQVKAVRSR